MSLYQEWLQAKEAERIAVDKRRLVEDQLIASLNIQSTEDGTKTIKDEGFKIKITTRISRSVDAEALQELAAQHGLNDHLASLFRWKPEINMREWKAAAPSITEHLAEAITAKPGRPSFSIEVDSPKSNTAE